MNNINLYTSFLLKIALTCLVFLFTACDNPIGGGPRCVYTGDFGKYDKKTIVSDPKLIYQPTGIKVKAGEAIKLETSGIIDICPTTRFFDHTTTPSIRPNANYWQSTGIVVSEGEYISLSITPGSKYKSAGGTEREKGYGLYVHIGNPRLGEDPLDSPSKSARPFGRGGDFPNGIDIVRYNDASPWVFSMYENNNGTIRSGYSGSAPASGIIYFKYANEPGRENNPNYWDRDDGPKTVWSQNRHCSNGLTNDPSWCPAGDRDWTGDYYKYLAPSYGINITKGCPGKNGQYLRAVFVEDVPSNFQATEKTLYEDRITNQACEQPNTSAPGYDSTKETCVIKQLPNNGGPMKVTSYNLAPRVCNNNSCSSADLSVNNGVYVGTAPTNAQLWLQTIDTQIKAGDTAVNYSDNIGEYKVKLTTIKRPGSGFSDSINAVITPIKEILYGYCSDRSKVESTCPTGRWTPGIGKRIFNDIIDNPNSPFLTAVRAALALYIIIFGLMFGLGLTESPKEEFIIKSLKAAFVFTVISDGGWEFFNTYLFRIFTEGVNDLIGMMANSFSLLSLDTLSDPTTGQQVVSNTASAVSIGGSDPFAVINNTVSKFFSHEFWIKISGLLLSSSYGFGYFTLILVGVFIYIAAIIVAAVLYIISMFIIALLMGLAPIFITFILFSKTKGFFDGWIKSLISFTFQPVFVFTALSLFNIFVHSIMIAVLNFDTCWSCIASVDIGSVLQGMFQTDFGVKEKFCIFYFYKAVGPSYDGFAVPISMIGAVILTIITTIMLQFIKTMSSLVAELVSGYASLSLASIAQRTAMSGAAIAASFVKETGKAGLETLKGGVTGAKDAAKSAKKDGSSTAGAIARGALGFVKGTAGNAIKGAANQTIGNAGKAIMNSVEDGEEL